MDAIPTWALGLGTILIVLLAIEAGFRFGESSRRNSAEEKESPISAISAALLGLVAFMLAFTFSAVTQRFDDRRALVRDEANAIGTAWLRADFLPEAEHAETARLYRRYVDIRLDLAQTRDISKLRQALAESDQIQRQLWSQATTHGRREPHSPIMALYVAALNEAFDLHSTRLAVAVHTRLPNGIWIVLYALVILGMFGVGYQTAMAGSRRSRAAPVLAIAFSTVVTLIVSLDRPQSGFITVSQQPMADLRASMGENPAAEAGRTTAKP
jgi:hypothetical protein